MTKSILISVADRFWAKVDFLAPGGCWAWMAGKKENGYGVIGSGGRAGRQVYVHRFAWVTLMGPIPWDRQIDHLCRNRACVNPAHLEVVTAAENMRRQPKAISPVCARGHKYGPRDVAKNGRRECRECRKTRERSRVREGRVAS